MTAEQHPSPPRNSSSVSARPPGPFILATGIGLAVLALAVLAIATLDGGTRSFDEWLLRGLRETANPAVPLGPRWFQEFVRDVSALGSTGILTLVVVIVTGYLLVIGSVRKAAFL
ncbi:MAG TPA: PAP2 family protein, partial [Planctomycetes bacterium]|nr:PAP2 family protein [Planctomycetota bacterium]